MRKPLLLSLMFVVSLGAATQRPPVAACTSAIDACKTFVVLGKGPAKTMVYSSYPLTTRNDAIRRALVMVHGTNRNAHDYFNTAMAAAFLAGGLQDTIVVAPKLIVQSDPKVENEVVWPGGGDSWRSGGMSPTNADLSSFDVADDLLGAFANKTVFPNMRAIVVTGHSAGGQYTTRYAMANKVHESLGVPVTYVVANPSSYAWPDAMRTMPVDDGEPAAAKEGWSLTPDTGVHTKFTYGPYDGTARNCANYNRWPLGLENRAGYTAKMTDDQLRKQLVSRPTTFLVGQVDTLPLGGFDSSCSAMAQGPTRRARGEAYVKYINEKLGAKHPIQVVAECGHNNRCIYTDDAVLPLIFPKLN